MFHQGNNPQEQQKIQQYQDEFRHLFELAKAQCLKLCKQYSNDSERSYPCRGGIDYFFVDSKEDNTSPCGYRGNENLGKFWDLDMNALNTHATCYQCDWECFRDPSELFRKT